MYNSKLKIMDNELTFLSYNQGVNCEFRVDDILDSPLWVTDDSNGLIKAIPLLNADRIVSSNPNDIILDENKCVILENNEDTLISLITDDVGSVHFYTVELYSFAPYTEIGLIDELTIYCIVYDEYLNTLNNVEVKVLIDDEVVNTVTTDNNGVCKYKINEACKINFNYGEYTSDDIIIGEYHSYSLDLTCSTPIIESGDTATVVATLTDNNRVVTGASLSYTIKHGETTIDSGTDTTDENGEISISYTGTGIGDVDIIISYDELTETYQIVDAELYIPCTSDVSSYFTIPSGMQGKIAYDNNGMTISGLSSYQAMSLQTTYNTPQSIEFEVVAHSGSAPNVVYGQISSTWIYTEFNTNHTEVDFNGTKYDVGNTVGKYRVEFDTIEIRLYHEDTLVHTYTGGLSTLELQIAMSSSRSATIRDIIIKSL